MRNDVHHIILLLFLYTVVTFATPDPPWCWTPWRDSDGNSGTCDCENKERYCNPHGWNSFVPWGWCEDALEIECRVKDTGVDYKNTGEIVTCDKATGLYCFNNDNPGGCSNYELRLKCPCPSGAKCAGGANKCAVERIKDSCDGTFPPSESPTKQPTTSPSDAPTDAPTDTPTRKPTGAPSPAPTLLQTFVEVTSGAPNSATTGSGGGGVTGPIDVGGGTTATNVQTGSRFTAVARDETTAAEETNVGVWIALVLGICCLFCILFALLFLFFRRSKRSAASNRRAGARPGEERSNSLQEMLSRQRRGGSRMPSRTGSRQNSRAASRANSTKYLNANMGSAVRQSQLGPDAYPRSIPHAGSNRRLHQYAVPGTAAPRALRAYVNGRGASAVDDANAYSDMDAFTANSSSDQASQYGSVRTEYADLNNVRSGAPYSSYGSIHLARGGGRPHPVVKEGFANGYKSTKMLVPESTQYEYSDLQETQTSYGQLQMMLGDEMYAAPHASASSNLYAAPEAPSATNNEYAVPQVSSRGNEGYVQPDYMGAATGDADGHYVAAAAAHGGYVVPQRAPSPRNAQF